MLKYLFGLMAATGVLVTLGATAALPAGAATTQAEAASENWAGYVASGASGAFSKVSGSWVQPSADASAGDGDSAFWVGLGGDGQSDSLEQIGTEADVSQGQTSYSAWYELVPAAQVKLNLAIHPGDHVTAGVAASGTSVTVSLSDTTTGQSYSNTLQMTNPDTSSAEWIAEAPSASDGQGDLQPLPLADFGTVDFTRASSTAGGHTGTISDSSWTATPVQLSGSSGGAAQPSSLSGDGSSFSVSTQSGDVGYTSGGSGDGSSYGYGGGGYDGYGGYGGYGDGGGYGGGYGGYGGYGNAY